MRVLTNPGFRRNLFEREKNNGKAKKGENIVSAAEGWIGVFARFGTWQGGKKRLGGRKYRSGSISHANAAHIVIIVGIVILVGS
jgi:hypothetical protein